MHITFVLILTSLLYERGEGFFSKFSGRKKSESNRIDDEFVDVCKTVRVMPRIAMAVVGGAPLKSENSAPYIAAIGERTSNGSKSWFCGGSLISPYDILTAAHCLVSRNVSTIRLGSFSTKPRSTENDYEVLETIIHPGYKITESYNDIAVIRVKDRITLDDNIKPVCLPEDDSEKHEKERAKVIGWGAEEFGGEGTQKLQQVQVEVFSNSNCDKAYRNSTIGPKTFPRGIEKEQLCAGSSKGGKDACQGDSGGPLVVTDENGVVRQIGIVSTGAGCGFKMYPGVYTRVSSYIDWIKQQTKRDSSQSRSRNVTESSKEVNTPNKNHPSGGMEKPSKKPSSGQNSKNVKEESTASTPAKLHNDHSSPKNNQNSRESHSTNDFNHSREKSTKNQGPDKLNQNHGKPSTTSAATSTKQNGHSMNHHNNNRTDPNRLDVPGTSHNSASSSREHDNTHPRQTEVGGSSSREKTSSRHTLVDVPGTSHSSREQGNTHPRQTGVGEKERRDQVVDVPGTSHSSREQGNTHPRHTGVGEKERRDQVVDVPGTSHNSASSSREQGRIHPRAAGVGGSSSREKTSSRIPQEDQLSSSVQRPPQYRSP